MVNLWDLTGSRLRTLVFLRSNGGQWFTKDEVADELGISELTAEKALRDLEQMEITIAVEGERAANAGRDDVDGRTKVYRAEPRVL